MKLLAIESSFESCSVALWQDGDLLERSDPGPRGHARQLLPFVDELLGESGQTLGAFDAIGFSQGPGSFTSLRIGIGVVQGLAWGADLPVVPVSSLRCTAQVAFAEGQVSGADFEHLWVCMDARMDEVFTGCFKRQGNVLIPVGTERVCVPGDAVPPDVQRWTAVGNGFERFELLGALDVAGCWPAITPRAGVLAGLAVEDFAAGKAVPAEQAQPVYLRNKVADKPGEGRRR